ncbi:MAG: PEGA domain-containing protein [Myxococcota bacterium]
MNSAFVQVRRALPILCAGAFATLGPRFAWAEKPDVLLLPYQALNKGVQPELVEQTTVVVAQELGARGLTVSRADDVAESATPTKPSKESGKNAPTGDAQAGDKAQELINQSKAQMEDSNVAPAIDHLKKAVKLLSDNGDAVQDLRLLAEAYLQLGVAHFRDSDEDAADEALSQAVHFAPTRELSETDYPPIFIRVYNRVRYNVLKRPRAQIEVKATAGAQVFLDGRNLGKAPMMMNEVLPGAHWVRVEKAGEPVQVKKLLVRSKNTILVEFDGAAAEPAGDEAVGVLGAIAKNSMDKAHLEQLRAAGKRAGASFVVFGSIFRTETAFEINTAILAVSDGSVGRLVPIAFDLDMLSAQIEVFKLADDAKKQISGGKPASVVADVPFVIGPKIDLKTKKKAVVAAKEARVENVVAAPPPINPPKEPTIAAAPVGAGGAAAGGQKGGAVVMPASAVVPKDEIGKTTAAGGGGAAGMAPTASVVPIDENDDGKGGSTWWIWLLVGVAVAGAAAGGTAFAVSQSGGNQGDLRIRW